MYSITPSSESSLLVSQEKNLLQEAIAGLNQSPKVLPSKLLYDERGSQLFEAICELPEYYPTRTEKNILANNVSEIAQVIGSHIELIEFGSGASIKTRILLDALIEPVSYIPIDISGEQLIASAAKIQQTYPHIVVSPVHGDYTQKISDYLLPKLSRKVNRKIAFFPGSTIGNFHKSEVEQFLRQVVDLVGKGGGLLIGVDLKKNENTLIKAYNDSQGITAHFNLNLLHRLNRELKANFAVEYFEHRAIWNEEESRIEMHLISLKSQTAKIQNFHCYFEQHESICTEYSYKYSLEEFALLAADYFQVEKVWTDEESLFSVQYLKRK